jgi:glycosyltransferase involved in cell wall biosynthesis
MPVERARRPAVGESSGVCLPGAAGQGTIVARMRQVSVVIPTFQRCASVRRLLGALAAQTLPAAQFEVVVSIDGSTDATQEMLDRRPDDGLRLRWIAGPNRGRAAACNAGIRSATGELVVILDDDMEPEPQLLAAHVAEHGPGTRRCVMGAVPILAGPDAEPHVRYVARKFNEHLERLAGPGHRFVLRDFYSGNASIARAELLDAGLYDEAFRRYGNEDLELAQRLVANGVELAFSPAAVARQHYEKTLEALVRDEVHKGYTAALFVAKHPDVADQIKLGVLRREVGTRAVIRDLVVRLARRSNRTPRVVARALRATRRDGVYRMALDVCYLVGVEQARHAMRTAAI